MASFVSSRGLAVVRRAICASLALVAASGCGGSDAPSTELASEDVAQSSDALSRGDGFRFVCHATENTPLAAWPGRDAVCSDDGASFSEGRRSFGFAIHSAAWWPPKAPRLEGPTGANTGLAAADLLGQGLLTGPEDVAIDAAGVIYGGVADGRIVRLSFDASGIAKVDTFAQTTGRPLGLTFAPDGRLLVAVAEQGLVAIDTNGVVTTLVAEAAGKPVAYADGIDVTADGVVYFTDASTFAFEDYTLDYLDARPRGRLLRHDLRSGETTVLRDGLYFPNGVALAKDGSHLVFTETPRYRVSKFWLKGPRAGVTEVIADNLPGFPDGVSRATDGSLWVALYTSRNALLDIAHPFPLVKNVLASLPASLQPQPARYGFALHLDADGKALGSLQDASGEHVANVTSVREKDGFLYLASLTEAHVARIRVP